MYLHFLTRAEKNKILEQLNEQFGIEKLPYLLVKLGKDKIRAYSGSLSREELSALARAVNIELAGIYLCRIEQGNVRISHDSVSLLKNQISKNIIELSDSEADNWLHGQDIELPSEIKEKGFVILKHKEYIIGTGKSNGKIIFNFVPKERRIKN